MTSIESESSIREASKDCVDGISNRFHDKRKDILGDSLSFILWYQMSVEERLQG